MKKLLSIIVSAVMLLSCMTALSASDGTVIAKFSFNQINASDKTLDETYGGSAEGGYAATHGMLRDSALLYASVDGINRHTLSWSNYDGGDGNDYDDNDGTFLGAVPVIAANDDYMWSDAAVSPAYFEIVASTVGYTDVTFSADIGGSKKGAKLFTLEYSVDGVNYAALENQTYSITDNKILENGFVNIALPDVADNAEKIYLRVYAADNVTINDKLLSDNPSGGENAINNITLKGVPISGEISWMPSMEFVSAVCKDDVLTVSMKNVSGGTVSAKNVICLYNGELLAGISITEIPELAENRIYTVEYDVSAIDFDRVRVFNLNNLNDIEPMGEVLAATYNEITPTPTPTPDPYSHEPVYQDVPIVEINGDMTDISRENEKMVTLTYTSSTETFTSYAKIKWQGRSSVTQGYPKYNYSIKLYEDEAYSVKDKHQFKTWLPAHNYCLKANWIDSTHARNIVNARLAAKIQTELLPTGVNGFIDGFPIHVYVNNEDYGVYTWNIPKKDWTFGMDSDNPNHLAFGGEEQTGACLFEEESVNDSDWEMIAPDSSADGRDKLNRLISFVKDSSVEDFKANFNDYMNFDSVLNYYVFAHIVSHTDGFAKNMILYTFDGNVWYTGLYDMDSTYGLRWTGNKIIGADALFNPSNKEGTMYRTSQLWSKFEQAFGNEIYERYVELRAGALSDESIIAEFEYFMDGIGQELYDLDESVWENRDPNGKHRYIPSRNFRLDQIKQFLIDREPYAKAWFEGLRTGE